MSKRPFSLRPGEKLILESLLTGEREKRYKDLHEDTGLQSNILSKYLKRLQKLGLLDRDIDTRKYRLKAVSIPSLFLMDVLDFLKAGISQFLEKKEKAPSLLGNAYSWMAFIDDEEFKRKRSHWFGKYLKDDLFNNIQFTQSLNEVTYKIRGEWETYVLSQFKEDDKKIIRDYKHCIIDYIYIKDSKRDSMKTKQLRYAVCLQSSRSRMRRRYPNISIPEVMIRIETKELYKEHTEAYDGFWVLAAIVRGLKWYVSHLDSIGMLRSDFSDEEKIKLAKIEGFLEDPNNKKIYEAYLEEKGKDPRILVMLFSGGFGGYGDILKELFPESEWRQLFISPKNLRINL